MKRGQVNHGFKTWVHHTSRIVSWIARASLVATALLLTADVFLRGVFSKPIIGTVDLVGLLTVVVASCSMAYTASDRRHIAISSLTARFSVRSRAILNSVMFLLGAALAALIAWRMLTRAVDQMALPVGDKTSMLDIPYVPFIILSAVGFFLLGVEFLASVSELMAQARVKKDTGVRPTSEGADGAI